MKNNLKSYRNYMENICGKYMETYMETDMETYMENMSESNGNIWNLMKIEF